MTAIHPNRAAVEGGLARVYLSMRDYDKALSHAEAALKLHGELFDWLEFYNSYKGVLKIRKTIRLSHRRWRTHVWKICGSVPVTAIRTILAATWTFQSSVQPDLNRAI